MSSELLGSAGRQIGLDVRVTEGTTAGAQVQFDSSLIAGERDPSSQLTVGTRLSDQVQLILSQDLKEGSRSWIVSYLARSNLEARGLIGENNDRAYEFRHALDFGAPPESQRLRSTVQTNRVPPLISSIDFSGSVGYKVDILRENTRQRAGDVFDFHRWQEDQDRLRRFYSERGFREARIKATRNESANPNEVTLVLGTRLTARVPKADQRRQRAEALEILSRLRTRPGVILADEVGMGKTFVALAAACSVALRSPRGPVVVMVPANLIDKWEQDLSTFCELYLDNRHPVRREGATTRALKDPTALRFGVARDSIALMKLLDDRPRERCHLILLAQGAMARRQTDKWTRLALIAEALRRHARGKARRLIQVKRQIHRFLGELLWALGEERAHEWGEDLWQELIRTSPEVWRDIYNDAVRQEDRRLADDPVPKSVVRALGRRRVDLKPLAQALEPARAR